jgi:hypothetical protein
MIFIDLKLIQAETAGATKAALPAKIKAEPKGLKP